MKPVKLSYKQRYPKKGDSIVVEVEGYGPQRVRVWRGHAIRDAALGFFDHLGMEYAASQTEDRWGYPELEAPWRVFGEPTQSRRSKAAAKRFTPTAAQKAEIDAAVLKLLDEWGDGGVTDAGLLAEDLFRNHGWTGEGLWAFDAYYGSKKRERGAVSSSLKRLLRDGLVRRGEWVFKGRNEWQRWVHNDYSDTLPSWRR